MSDNSPIIKDSSKMTLAQIETFLQSMTIPVRLASAGTDGVPLVSSLWYLYKQDAFYCATHKSSLLAKRLLANPDCGFEVAADSMPYCGVRGQGRVEVQEAGAEQLLRRLFSRYDIDADTYLAKWLMSRKDDEYVLRVAPSWLTSWDFTDRMAK